jgi:hypothetical protein
MAKIWILTVTLAIALATGCSSSATSAPAAGIASTVAAALPNVPATAAASVAPKEPSTTSRPPSAPEAPQAEPAAPVFPLPEMADLFAPPKAAPVEVAEEPPAEPEFQPEPAAVEQPQQEKRLPQVRLIGFVTREGSKALLSIDGQVNVATTGDSAAGVQVLAIEPPVVTLKHDEGEPFQINLYEQPWYFQPRPLPGERKLSSPRGSSLNRFTPGSPGNLPPLPAVPSAGPTPGIPSFAEAPIPPATGAPGLPTIPGDSSTDVKNTRKTTKKSPPLPGLPGTPPSN